MNRDYFLLDKIELFTNQKTNLEKIFYKVKRKFTLNEILLFAFSGYYLFKKNYVLVFLTNEKIFVADEHNKMHFCGVYSYKEMKQVDYYENENKPLASYIIFNILNRKTFKLKGISVAVFLEFKAIFDEQKNLYLQNLNKLNTITKNQLKEDNSTPSNLAVANNQQTFNNALSNYNAVINVSDLTSNQSELEFESDPLTSKFVVDPEDASLNTAWQTHKKNEYNRTKKVINDKYISNMHTFSSLYIYNLLTKPQHLLPDKTATLFHNWQTEIKELQNNRFTNLYLDEIPLKIHQKQNKLNTVAVLVESQALHDQENGHKTNQLLFARNWIEYTKHNVSDKLLAVDLDGNGCYLDAKSFQKQTIIHHYKAQEYKIGDQIRYGLRSNQTVFYQSPKKGYGLASLYYEKNSLIPLQISDYDGIIFQGVKYYFDYYDEFSKLQQKYLKIYFEAKKPNQATFCTYQLIFTEDSVTYQAHNQKGALVDDDLANASLFDLKWLTFFKD